MRPTRSPSFTFLLAILLLAALTAACGSGDTPAESAAAVKILVEETGLYSVTAQELQQAGLNLETLDATNLGLSQGGQPVPYTLHEEALIFYGRAPESRYTNNRTYILRTGDAGLLMERSQTPETGGPRLSQVRRTHHLEQNLQYVSDAQIADRQGPWFWQRIQPEATVSLPFTLPDAGDGSGQLTVNLYGTTHSRDHDPDHSLGVRVNDNQLSALSWDGQTAYTGTLSLPPGTLRSAQNEIVLQNLPQEVLDIMQLNWASVAYNAAPVADDDYLTFHGARGRLTITGFSRRPLILDVADPEAPTLLEGWSFEGGNVELATAEDMQVVAATTGSFRRPTAMQPLRENNWDNAERQADLIIITTDELAPALDPLVEHRESQGLSVTVVPVAEIYDTFGHGAATPDSINNFLQFTYHNWQDPKPRYVLLVGEATIDFRGYLADRPENPVTPPENAIPPYVVPVAFGGETVSDARLADVEGDVRPELAIGRWPVDSRRQVRDLVQRTLAYESGSASSEALFAADGSSGEFEAVTERILEASAFPPAQSRVLVGPTAGELAERWNQGAWLVTYTGHGSLELWGRDEVFSVNTATQIEAGTSSPIVVQLTCLTGLFAHPETRSLSEVLLTQEGGPVLVVAATSLTLSAHQEPFAASLLQALQDPAVERIGDALQESKRGLDVSSGGLREISDTFGLLGDPSAHIVRP